MEGGREAKFRNVSTQFCHHLKNVHTNYRSIDTFTTHQKDEQVILDTLQWITENRKELNGCSDRAINYAARNGHLDVVRWLHHNSN